MPLGQLGLPGSEFRLPGFFGLDDSERGKPGQPRPEEEFPPPEPPALPGEEFDPGAGGFDDCLMRCIRPIQMGEDLVSYQSEQAACLQECRGPSGKPTPNLDDLQLGTPGGEGGAGGGGGGGGIDFNNLGGLFSQFQGIGPFTDNPLLQQLQAFLSQQLEGPFGIDPDVMRRQRNIITGSGAQREQQSLQNLAASLNTVGQLGGGRQIQLGREISEDTRRGVSGQLNELATLDAMRAQADRDAIVGQILGFGGLLGQSGSQQISQQLGMGDLQLREMLGLGQLRLGQGDLDLRRLLGIGGLQQSNLCIQLRSRGINIC